MNVTIIGTGKMANAISTRLLEGGHHIYLIEHTPGKAKALAEDLKGRIIGGNIEPAKPDSIPGEVVVLAVPYGALESIIRQYEGQLSGKILVDITNTFNFQRMEPLLAGDSAAEQIARLMPANTRVVKAFTTVLYRTILAGKIGGQPLDVFIAGDDAEAKAKIAQLVESGGMRAIDAGPLIRARELEALGFLHVAIQSTTKTQFMSAIKVLS